MWVSYYIPVEGATEGVSAGVGVDTNFNTSSFLIWPSGPDPVTEAKATPCSLARVRANGVAKILLLCGAELVAVGAVLATFVTGFSCRFENANTTDVNFVLSIKIIMRIILTHKQLKL